MLGQSPYPGNPDRRLWEHLRAIEESLLAIMDALESQAATAKAPLEQTQDAYERLRVAGAKLRENLKGLVDREAPG